MRILRSLIVAGLFGVSLTVIGFTCVDRLDHPVKVAAPVPAVTRPMLADPVATGSLGTGSPPPEAPAPIKAAKPARQAMEGFDTERLNALMRGDPSVTLSRTR